MSITGLQTLLHITKYTFKMKQILLWLSDERSVVLPHSFSLPTALQEPLDRYSISFTASSAHWSMPLSKLHNNNIHLHHPLPPPLTINSVVSKFRHFPPLCWCVCVPAPSVQHLSFFLPFRNRTTHSSPQMYEAKGTLNWLKCQFFCL